MTTLLTPLSRLVDSRKAKALRDHRDIDTVEIAALLRESDDGLIRVSLRGKSSADVSKIATRFGGGGHRLAAGCTMQPPIDQAYNQILECAKQLLLGALC